ncbi:hypothetical protein CDIK_4289 [Cucumispora dikerogammari]|nr:hypothetical protein CDIK_4289 [Cucumispora dikerogammari]
MRVRKKILVEICRTLMMFAVIIAMSWVIFNQLKTINRISNVQETRNKQYSYQKQSHSSDNIQDQEKTICYKKLLDACVTVHSNPDSDLLDIITEHCRKEHSENSFQCLEYWKDFFNSDLEESCNKRVKLACNE